MTKKESAKYLSDDELREVVDAMLEAMHMKIVRSQGYGGSEMFIRDKDYETDL